MHSFRAISAKVFHGSGLNSNKVINILRIHENTNNCFKYSSTKAAVCHQKNEPLKVEDVKEKKLKKGEVKIKVKYCALNPRDLQLVLGHVDEKLPFVPGYEVSGEIIERYEDDKEVPFEIGDKVIALTKSSLGGLSSHCIAEEEDVWKYQSLDPKVAAGLIVNYGHSLLSLFRRAKIKKNMTVLVTSDSGGLGLAALDIAANVYKAKVVGVCGSELKADVMREKGAWSALKMDIANMKASVQDITGGKGVDVVYDTVGRDFLKGAVQCVKHEGIVILADVPGHEDLIKPIELFNLDTFNLTAVTLNHYRQHDLPVYRQVVSDVIELCEQSLISPHVSQTFDLEHVNEAVQLLQQDQIIGKILVKLPSTKH
uniref:Enoyl reductase (ER) domain-containing protein n=1 Tax=Graphocephala atropunctata TaxID=36148 RepID=A0A1B6LH94_9HEMI